MRTKSSPKSKRPYHKIRHDAQLLAYQDVDCYETGYNLSPEQNQWLNVARLFEEILDGRRTPQYMNLAFRSNPRLPGTRPLQRDQVCRIEDLLVLSCNFIPRAACVWHTPECYRLNWLEHRVRCNGPSRQGDDGCLYVSTSHDDREQQFKLRQRDLFRAPISRLQDMRLVQFDQDKTRSDEEALLRAPCGGDFSVEHTTKHVNLRLNGHTVFRFLRKDADCVTLSPEGRVEKQAVLGQLTRHCYYAVASGNEGHCPQPSWLTTVPTDRFATWDIEPGGLQALRIATRQMELIGLAETGQFDLVPASSNAAEHLPVYLIELDERQVRMLPQQQGWYCTDELREALVEVLRPDSDAPLFAPARCGNDTVYESQREDAATGSLVVRYSNGVEQKLPLGVSLLDSVLQGARVRPGDPLAYWLTGGADLWSLTWDRLAALPYLAVLVNEFLHSVLIPSGARGYQGSKTLLPAKYVPDSLRLAASARYMDFSNMTPFYDENLATFFTPPLRQQNWQDMQGEYQGVVYDATPRELLRDSYR